MAQAENKSTNSRLNEILRRKNLSVTDSRRKILTLFLSTPDAMAHGDIEKKAGEKFDRVTIYRTLQTFVEKGIVHTIPTADNSVLYALCKDCAEGHHHDDHVHFVCSQCDRTICLDDVVSPKIDLPEGYIADNVQVVIHGTCKDCNNK
ncbi:Fur family transcriptional regulator [Flavisolibacter ginsengisoli]|jgi:Fur family transcriptional regulator, ferric uptake regulator|uniref:Fur family transcriptional regulator, ferric uptake regulator n=1 Tax=Flavisolibacter ginsengisoli DSM 18119 TaxID=1121884 RepID=A0A1M4Y1C8_9BACT|nr:transcriptional repressor [Flavisolibacter ginsengisoli]SHE99515.1 Fur family transcriptional regulator, ferric uptake regulator [Flavisolibacter ginsengisoli DSM 18119]